MYKPICGNRISQKEEAPFGEGENGPGQEGGQIHGMEGVEQ